LHEKLSLVFIRKRPYRLLMPTSLLPSTVAGFGAGAGLIVAIGAQNAFVLRQGLDRGRIALVVVICVVSDAALILAGVAGLGSLVDQAPGFLTVIRWAGAAFLVAYGLLAARRALHPAVLDPSTGPPAAVRGVAVTALALTWLNPHVYLDTVILLGSLAAAQGDPDRWAFGIGAMVAGALWFSALGFGARRLGRLLHRPAAWRLLDSAIAIQMFAIAALLLIRP
jgi:L-lysine exporter family protein LysE/ArgO